MGGCRCTFRSCPINTTNSPGMHFFHYPFKDWERCQLWTKYANRMEFLSLEFTKLRNKVVCERHFRDECFMNYKRDRLIQNAIPTLDRLENDSVLDYQDGENPTPKYLPPTNLKHLQPPNKQTASLSPSNKPKPESESFLEIAVTDSQYEESPPPAKIAKFTPAPRILNVDAPQNIKIHKIRPRMKKDDTPSSSSSAAFVLQVEDAESEIELDMLSNQVHEVIVPDDAKNDEAEEMYKSMLAEKELEFTAEVETLKGELAAKDVHINLMKDEIEQLKAQMEESKAQAEAAITQVKTISTSIKMESSAAPSSATPLTKAQLFNNIKKYLCPSMMSMVRMEMFGGPEREWKKDERNVSVELLSLGGHVFDYIRDEWRCRLPPKKDVEQWLSQRCVVEDEEDL